jgi:[ribosomal protein S5]-alanine N-acetyltransferase
MTSPITIELPLEGYALRAWQLSDAHSMAQHLNNPNIGRNMADWYPAQGGYTLAHAEAWVREGHKTDGTNWAVTHHNEAIGACSIHTQEDFDRCNAEIGYWLAESHWGKGLGTAIVRRITEEAFKPLHITRVFAPIHAHNRGSQRICEKSGFTCEGLRRLSVMKQGKAIDTVVWAAYRDTWTARSG